MKDRKAPLVPYNTHNPTGLMSCPGAIWEGPQDAESRDILLSQTRISEGRASEHSCPRYAEHTEGERPGHAHLRSAWEKGRPVLGNDSDVCAWLFLEGRQKQILYVTERPL